MNVDPYSSAMERVTPGTFAPDMAPKAPASEPLGPDAGTPAVSFKDTVKSMLDGVNDKMTAADQASEDLATGKSNDFDGTVKAVEQASLAFQMTMAVRNQLMTAYTEVNQTQF
jgi:flagellar hook-basal body complex protein FliE